MDLAQAVPSFGAFWRRKRALAAAVMATKGLCSQAFKESNSGRAVAEYEVLVALSQVQLL